MSPDTAELRKTASRLAAKGKGLLASDESIGTIGKRLEKAGTANTEVVRGRCCPALCDHSLTHKERCT